MIDANSKVAESTATTPDDALASLVAEVRAVAMPQPFPDTTLKKRPA